MAFQYAFSFALVFAVVLMFSALGVTGRAPRPEPASQPEQGVTLGGTGTVREHLGQSGAACPVVGASESAALAVRRGPGLRPQAAGIDIDRAAWMKALFEHAPI